jgi:hypothetical protein
MTIETPEERRLQGLLWRRLSQRNKAARQVEGIRRRLSELKVRRFREEAVRRFREEAAELQANPAEAAGHFH